MSVFPVGFVSVRMAAERLGAGIFGDWTGKEAAARQGLVSLDEWAEAHVEKVPVSGSGAPGGPLALVAARTEDVWPYGDPTAPDYQAERAAAERWREALARLQQMLAHGKLAGALLYRTTGRVAPLSPVAWLEAAAERSLIKGRARDGGEVIVSEDGLSLVAPAPAATNVLALVRPARKVGSVERAAEFRRWVEGRAANGERPTVSECNAWAAARGIGRDWVRDRRRELPQELRRKRGEHG